MVDNHYDSLVENIVKSPGLVMLVGPSDSGKTTMAKYLLSKLCLFRSKVGFVDSDVGQSTIGPPGTIGAAIFNSFDPQKDWEQQAQSIKLYFIGAFSPPGHILELLLGLKKMVDYLKQLNCDIIIVDTTGLVKDRLGLYLKKSKIELLNPTHLIVFQNNNELHILTKIYAKSEFTSVSVFPISNHVKKRSLEQRRLNREKKLNRYFEDSVLHEISFPSIIQWKKNIITNSYFSKKELSQLSSILQKEIHCAAITHRTLVIISNSWFYCDKIAQLKEKFPIDSIYILLKQNLIHKYVSLEDRNSNVLTLAVVKNINFNKHIITLKSPLHRITNCHLIKFGMATLHF